MGSGQEWWAHKEREMREAEQARQRRWVDFREANLPDPHTSFDLEQLRAEFNRSEAVRFTLEKR